MAYTVLIKHQCCFSFLSIFCVLVPYHSESEETKTRFFFNQKIIKDSSNAIYFSVSIQVYDLIMPKSGDIGQSE